MHYATAHIAQPAMLAAEQLLPLHMPSKRYCSAYHHCVGAGKLNGISNFDLGATNNDEEWDSITFEIVRGVTHHLQNHNTWKMGGKAVRR